MFKTTICVLIILVFMGMSTASDLPASQIPELSSEGKIVASRLNFWNRIGVIAKQVSLGKDDADHVRIMNLYRLDKLEGNSEQGTVEELSKKTIEYLRQGPIRESSADKAEEPPIFLVEESENSGDFVGTLITFTLKTDEAQVDNSYSVKWDQLIREVEGVFEKELQLGTGSSPFYIATEQELAWLTPKSSVVFFDFDASEIYQQVPPIATIP